MFCIYLICCGSFKFVQVEEGYPELSNVMIDEDGIMTWDAYPGADYYHVFYEDDIHIVGSGTYSIVFGIKGSFHKRR